MAYQSKFTGAEVDSLLEKVQKGEAGGSVTVDSSLSTTSENPVMNKVITEGLNKKLEGEVIGTTSPTEGTVGESYDDTELRNAIAGLQQKDVQTDAKLTELSARTIYKNPLQGVTFGSSERDSVLKKVLKYIWLEVVDSSFELPKQWRFYLLRNSQAKSPQFMVQICLADSEDVVFTYSNETKVTDYAEFVCSGFSSHKNKVNLHFGVDFSEFLDDINYATSFGTYIYTDEVNRYEVKEDEYLNESVKKIEEKVIENSSVALFVQDQSFVTKVDGVNLYDNRLEAILNTLINQNGIISSVGYFSSFPIFLKKGKYAVTHNHSSLGANTFFAEVDVQGEVISLQKGILAEDNNIIQVVLNKDGYYKFNIGNSTQLATFMVTKDGEYPSEYVPYQTYINNALVRYQDIIGISTDNPLSGKIISLNGDSICAGSGGYGKIIAERNKMVYENIAVSGGTITAETYSNGIARHWISRTIGNMRADADFAIVEGGVNDSSLAVPLGSISNGYDATLDDTTFYGAFESMLKQLLLRFQGKKVGYIFVHQTTNNFRHLNEKEGSYYWAARMCCEKWGVPYCDLNVTVPAFGLFKSSSDMYVLTQQYTKNSDGWHPNEEGYKKYYCNKIEAWLKTL